MKERILKNALDYDKWVKDSLYDGDSFEPPTKYPCLASTDVHSWNCETEIAKYLYMEDIVNILKEMKE